MTVEITVRSEDYAKTVADLYIKGVNFTATPSKNNADEYIITLLGF